MYWSVIETNVGIFAASAPSFKAIASRFLPRIIGEYSGRKSSANDTYPRKYGSGFSKVRDPNAVPMDTLPGTDDLDQEGNDVRNGGGHTLNSSIERMIPDGRIMTQTQISTNIEVCRDHDDLSSSFERRF